MTNKIAAEYVDINTLTPWDKNPRKNDHAVPEVMESIQRFGFSSPIIARKSDNVIIAGHTRWKAAKKIGLTEVPVRFMDLDIVDSQLLAIADNKLNERASWDDSLLEEVLNELSGEDLTGLGFDDAELDNLIQSTTDDTKEESEELPELEEEIHSQVGEVYELGPHRLMCGDSTKNENWDILLDGEEIDMIFTDPPYGVSYVGQNDMKIQNDDLSGENLYQFLDQVFRNMKEHLKPGGSIYVASPSMVHIKILFMRALLNHDLVRHNLLWIKNRFVLGRADYHYQYEDIFYGWKEGASHYFINDRTKTTNLEFDRPQSNNIHPTMKPVLLIEELILNSSRRREIIADAFGGSGSTLIAADKNERYARLIELDPKYCDAIRRRWTRYAKENGLEVGTGGLE